MKLTDRRIDSTLSPAARLRWTLSKGMAGGERSFAVQAMRPLCEFSEAASLFDFDEVS